MFDARKRDVLARKHVSLQQVGITVYVFSFNQIKKVLSSYYYYRTRLGCFFIF